MHSELNLDSMFFFQLGLDLGWTQIGLIVLGLDSESTWTRGGVLSAEILQAS